MSLQTNLFGENLSQGPETKEIAGWPSLLCKLGLQEADTRCRPDARYSLAYSAGAGPVPHRGWERS